MVKEKQMGKIMGIKKWTEEEFRAAVKNNNTITDIARTLGYSVLGRSQNTIKKWIKKFDIDTSHFWNSTDQLRISGCMAEKLSDDELFSITDRVRGGSVKARIIKRNLLKYECSECKITSWNNKNLVLQLDHISGNNKDNRLENLRFLCPNCHSQTDTYCGKHIKKEKNEHHCPDCDKIIYKLSKQCRECRFKSGPSKIEWPNLEILEDIYQKFGYQEAGRRLGVSGRAVRKRINKLKLQNIQS